MAEIATPTVHETLIDLIRTEVRDPLLDRAGNPVLQTRYTPAAVDSAIKHAAMWMQREMRLVNPSEAYMYADGTYTAASVSSALPAGVGWGDPIAKVESIEDPLRPMLLPSCPFDEIERYAISTQIVSQIPRSYPYKCCLVDGPDVGTRHLIIRPRPSGALAIRVWFLRAPVLYGAGEAQMLASHWEDLLSLLAALALQGRLEGLQEGQNARLDLILPQFRAAANRRRQTQRIRRGRRGFA